MPRKLPTQTTLNNHLRQLIYTRAALAADPQARDLLPMTDGWEARVDAVLRIHRLALNAQVGADALRRVSNTGLDTSCMAFGAELGLKEKPGTEGFRYFFRNLTPSRFIKQALATQVGAVEAWLGATDNAVFERHRAMITTWVVAAREALTATDASANPIGTWQVARARLAEDMTRERDGLWAALDERRRAENLPRDWPDLFFRVESSESAKAEDAEDEDVVV